MRQLVAMADRPRLERRPEATAHAVDDLLAMVKEGQVRIPRFQRGLKWKHADQIDLLDSMYRGYPIGTLLFWRKRAEAGTAAFGTFEVHAAGRDDALWIVDGQQRITALATLLLGPAIPGRRAVCFDLEAEAFRQVKILDEERTAQLPGMTETSSAALVPANVLFDSSKLIEWTARRLPTSSSTTIQRALECGKRLREYRVPAYVVDTPDEDVVREIFERCNRTGKRLDETDVFTALFDSFTADEGTTALQRIVRATERIGFGAIDERAALVAFRAVSGLPVDKDYKDALDRAGAAEGLRQTEAALERAIRFLRTDGRVPHYALLPYELPLVVLTRFFHHFPEPGARSRTLLRRWLWRGSLGETLGGASASMRQHVDCVGAVDEERAVQALLRLTHPEAAATPASFGAFSLATARSCLVGCALASLDPLDVRTDEKLDLARVFLSNGNSLPAIVEAPASELEKSVANRLLHPKMTAKALTRAIVEAAADVLASHGIPEEARRRLAAGDAAGFLSARKDHLSVHFERFFSARAEFGADDSPSIASMIDE